LSGGGLTGRQQKTERHETLRARMGILERDSGSSPPHRGLGSSVSSLSSGA